MKYCYKLSSVCGNVYGNGHEKMYGDIIKYFSDGIEYPVNMRDALGTIQLLNSFYLSDESKDWQLIAKGGDSNRLGRVDESLAQLYRTSVNINDMTD